MSRDNLLNHEFVEYLPGEPDQGTVYISVKYATAVHKCCCGCGSKVITPLSPTDWKLIFDGETISLDPSIGNWSFPCKSHYWIRANKVRWARLWSDEEIEATRKLERTEKESYFGLGLTPSSGDKDRTSAALAPDHVATPRRKKRKRR